VKTKMSTEPLIKADPVKAFLRLIGVEQATPQEQQAEVAKPEPEGIQPLQTVEAQPVETLPAQQEPVAEKPAEPAPAVEPLPMIALQPAEAPLPATQPTTTVTPTSTTSGEAPLQPYPIQGTKAYVQVGRQIPM
jgi:hypothetical protein